MNTTKIKINSNGLKQLQDKVVEFVELSNSSSF